MAGEVKERAVGSSLGQEISGWSLDGVYQCCSRLPVQGLAELMPAVNLRPQQRAPHTSVCQWLRTNHPLLFRKLHCTVRGKRSGKNDSPNAFLTPPLPPTPPRAYIWPQRGDVHTVKRACACVLHSGRPGSWWLYCLSTWSNKWGLICAS